MAMLFHCISLLSSVVSAATKESFWFPVQASTVAHKVDWLYDFVMWVSVISFVLIMAAVVWFLFRYRARRGQGPEESSDHNQMLEVTWTIIPTIICIFIFYFGITGYIDLRTTPTDSYEIQVTGRKWSWQFTYPNGYVDSNLHVPKDRDVRLVMSSEDVLHSFFIPAFRVKMDVVPGRFTDLWFNATELGEFQIFCTEYCGTKHSAMLAKVIVHDSAEFKTWLDDAGNLLKNLSPVDAGEALYKQRGCAQCHSVDGTKGIAPSFKDLYGTTRSFQDGTSAKADENYIRESILEPQAKVVAGYPPVMPTFKGKMKDEEISALIAYLKSLSGQGGKP